MIFHNVKFEFTRHYIMMWSFCLPPFFPTTPTTFLTLNHILHPQRLYFNCLWHLFWWFHVCDIDHLSYITITAPQTSIAFVRIRFPAPPRPHILSLFTHFLPNTSPSGFSVTVFSIPILSNTSPPVLSVIIYSITIPPLLTATLVVEPSASPSPFRPTNSL